MKMITALVALTLFVPAFASAEDMRPVRTVPQVNLNRYMGKWFEISSFPQSFQKGCTKTTATYSLRSDGKVDVLNQCIVNGKLKNAKGVAYAADNTNAKLRVSFFWPFYGNYWVVDLGRNYEFAVVGAPGRDYLWILSRTPRMSKRVYEGILQRLHEQQFDLSKLQMTGEVL